MRLALQVSGEMRTVDYAYECLKKYILDPIGFENVDIFLHTWYKNTEKDDQGHGYGIAKFNPRAFSVDKPDAFPFIQTMPRSMSMFFSIRQANQLRKEYEKMTGVKYDLVMRYRTDCIFTEYPLAGVEVEIQKHTPFLAIPITKDINNIDGPSRGDGSLCDWIAYGTPECMDVYCGTFDTWYRSDFFPIPESMLSMNLQLHGITQKTSLKRPELHYFLIEKNGKIRGLDEFVRI